MSPSRKSTQPHSSKKSTRRRGKCPITSGCGSWWRLLKLSPHWGFTCEHTGIMESSQASNTNTRTPTSQPHQSRIPRFFLGTTKLVPARTRGSPRKRYTCRDRGVYSGYQFSVSKLDGEQKWRWIQQIAAIKSARSTVTIAASSYRKICSIEGELCFWMCESKSVCAR